jgi:hypothetical protein
VASAHATPAIRREIARWLPRLLNARLRDLVEEHAPFPGEQFPTHGILTRATRKAVVAATLRDVVVPGFTRAGVDPTHAVAWARGAFG